MSLNNCQKNKIINNIFNLSTFHRPKLSVGPFSTETLKIIFVSKVYFVTSRPVLLCYQKFAIQQKNFLCSMASKA